MEINSSNITEKSHHDNLFQSSSNSKSYTCSFCKKGFSNAQALGGHMNIHRKDRARLRQAFADEVLLSLDITSSASSSIDQGSQNSDDKSILMVEPNDDNQRSQKMQKQPFLVDANLKSSEASGDEKIQSRSHDLPQNEILDLELRLGPEPHDTSARSRREFF